MAASIPQLSLAELSAALQRRQVSATETVQSYLDRIAKLDGTLHAYLAVYPEQALEAARQADREIAAGRWRGPLHGAPIAVKDIFDVAGMATTCGSAIYRDREPAWEDAHCVARLRQAGAIVLGKLNTHEFAGGPTGINLNFGPERGTARNPWNPACITGGSSSGSGAATAAGLAAATLGSDTGGSIRIPAHLCGIVGHKPTHGLVSLRGIFPVAGSLDHAGPMTRTVADAALMLRAMAGHDPLDPYSRAAAVPDYPAALSGGLKGLSIAVPENFFFDDVHPEIERAVRAALGVLGELGAEVRPIELSEAQTVWEQWEPIHLVEWNLVHADHLAHRAGDLGKDISTRLARVSKHGPMDYARAMALRERLRGDVPRLLRGCDLLAAPAGMLPAVPIAEPSASVNGKTLRAVEVNARLTRFATFTGQPALSLPCGFTKDGLPIGLQLMGWPFRDDVVLRAAQAYEQATDWHQRRPPVG